MPPVSSRTIIRSRPLTTSSFRVEAFANCGNKKAGRKFANKPSSARIANNPLSGRRGRSIDSHLGPPTDPSNIAVDSLAFFNVSSGKGVPVASTALPPINPCSNLTASSPSVIRNDNTFLA